MAQNHNRSSEELQIRDMVVAWGRKRWPDARVFHELTTGKRRIDLAFITPTNLIGVEIKSSKDTLDRLDDQLAEFNDVLPCVYVAYHSKWTVKMMGEYFIGGKLEVLLTEASTEKPGVYELGWRRHADINWQVCSRLVWLLWAAEARSICMRHGLVQDKKAALGVTLPLIAQHLTGTQIIAEVCRELRGRPTLVEASDAPIYDAPRPIKPAIAQQAFL